MRYSILVLSILGVSSNAFAQTPDSAAQPAPAPVSGLPAAAQVTPAVIVEQTPTKVLGIGYKLGNGIGILGADIVINPMPHLAVDLYAAFVPVQLVNGTASDSATEYAMAPAIQYELFAGQRSTPYAAVGVQYAHLTLDGVSASALGIFANIGYEWKWKNGFGLQLGGGVQALKEATAMNATTKVTIGGKVNPNLEFGVRYMFF